MLKYYLFRTLCFNSDASCILSGSSESIKVWNRYDISCKENRKCITISLMQPRFEAIVLWALKQIGEVAPPYKGI